MLACAALAAFLAAPRSSAQESAADLREDVRGLTQRVNELSLRIEQLEHGNAGLEARVGALGGKDAVTAVQLNGAVADLNASMTAAIAASRSEILQQVATQMENLAKQTNAALDSIAKQSAPARLAAAEPQAPAAKPVFGESYSKQGLSYTVQKGDTIGVIAKKTGAKSQDIIDANKIADPSRIQVGQILFVPGGK
jgi:LysM repeat protein